jgi:hypothetical protein
VYGPGDLLASAGTATFDAASSGYVGGDANGYGYRPVLGEIHTAGAVRRFVKNKYAFSMIRMLVLIIFGNVTLQHLS